MSVISMASTFTFCRRFNILSKFSQFRLNDVRPHTLPVFGTGFKTKFSTISSVLDTNTNVIKDVLLYKYEATYRFRMMNFFALAQFIFWNFLAETMFSTLRNIPVNEATKDEPWYKRINWGQNRIKYCLTALCLILGNGSLAVAYFYTTRSVRMIVLRKGGTIVSIVLHSPIGREPVLEVPVHYISAAQSRASSKAVVPLKIRGKSLFYLVDKEGKFGNLRLFDATVGLSRKWKK